jgi:hypothetical protein
MALLARPEAAAREYERAGEEGGGVAADQGTLTRSENERTSPSLRAKTL